ncbi:MAG: hypothetical protein ACYSWU_27235, partial [Planctomycetota bacterium]
MQRNLAALILVTIVVGGCGGDGLLDRDKPRRGPATQAAGQLAPVDQEGNPVGKPPPPPPSAGQPKGDGSVPPPPPPADTVKQQAHPGVTGKGQNYGGGLITTPIAVYFGTRERIVFNIEVPHALRLYQGLEGHAPKTHEEFMKGVI